MIITKNKWQMTHVVTLAMTAVTLITGCAKGNVGKRMSSISVEREVLVPGVRGQPTAMARVSSGGFVIVGGFDAAWAVGTDSGGNLSWKYEETLDPEVKYRYQSRFYGVVSLPDGGTLLCGETSNKDHQAGVGLVVRLDQAGKVVDHRLLYPHDDVNMHASSLRKCIRWGDEILLTGTGNADKPGQRSFIWAVKLDENGEKQWESTDERLPGIEAIIAADGTLIMAGADGPLARLSQDGKVITTSQKTGISEMRILRQTVPTSNIELIAVDRSQKNVLFSFDSNLKQTSQARDVGPPSIRDGCGYVLSDGSSVLFGSSFVNGNVYRSAIGWVNKGGRDDVLDLMPIPNPQDASGSILDAIAVSSDEFITMRSQLSAVNPTVSGVVLSWVSLQ